MKTLIVYYSRTGTTKKVAETLKYDLVIVGTPIWAWNVTPAIRTYLTNFKNQFQRMAFFCTEGNNGGERAFGEMEKVCGLKPQATLELTTREVNKNDYLEKLKDFINLLHYE